MSDHATVNEPSMPEAAMHLVPPTAPTDAVVTSTSLCTKGKSASVVRHVCIDVGGTPLEGRFLAGQSFGVVPPGTDANGKPHKVRLYSIASPGYGEDGHGRVLSTTVKRLIDERKPQRPGDDPDDHGLFLGVCSNFLCDRKAGDVVQVTGPAGKRFLLPTDRQAHDYVFVATGTGIAPFRGMIHELLVGPPEGTPARAAWRPSTSSITLVMGTPYTTDLIYDEWFAGLAAAHPNFTYHTVISRESAATPGRGAYVHQFMDGIVESLRPTLAGPRGLIYLCGLSGMQVGVYRMLARHGLGDQYLSLHEELAGVAPDAWTDDQLRRRVHATRRCMVEVY
jgi:ferredoxin--NADP+ reductase